MLNGLSSSAENESWGTEGCERHQHTAQLHSFSPTANAEWRSHLRSGMVRERHCCVASPHLPLVQAASGGKQPTQLMYSASCQHPRQGLAPQARTAGFSFSKMPPRNCSMATECLVAVLKMKHKPFLCVAVSKEQFNISQSCNISLTPAYVFATLIQFITQFDPHFAFYLGCQGTCSSLMTEEAFVFYKLFGTHHKELKVSALFSLLNLPCTQFRCCWNW